MKLYIKNKELLSKVNKMKKIALIYTGMNIGGAQRVLVDLAKNMKNIDKEVIVITDKGPMIREIEEFGIKHYLLPLKSKKPQNVIRAIRGLLRIIKEEEIDIVHSHHRYITMLLNMIKPIIKVPIVHTEHNVFPDKNLVNFRGKNIIAVSNMVSQHLISIGVKSESIQVIQNGIYIDNSRSKYDLREELELPKDTIIIGVLARLVKEKGHEFMINSIKDLILRNKQVKVIFIGDGPERSNIENLISRLGLNDNIILLGNRSDVKNILDCINFFVLPSFYEGLPMSILEIMSKGKVVIATDVGGNKEVIINNFNSFLINSNNSKELYSKTKYCIDNINSLKDIEINALKTIKEKFSIERVMEEHNKYYKILIEKEYDNL